MKSQMQNLLFILLTAASFTWREGASSPGAWHTHSLRGLLHLYVLIQCSDCLRFSGTGLIYAYFQCITTKIVPSNSKKHLIWVDIVPNLLISIALSFSMSRGKTSDLCWFMNEVLACLYGFIF